MEQALESCPFCGEPPAYEPRNPERDGDAWSKFFCDNPDCPVTVEVSAYADTGHYQTALERWNRRPEPSAPSPAGVEVDPNFRKIAWEIADECWLDTASKHDLSKRIEGALTASLDQATRRAEDAQRAMEQGR